jgi:YjbE family integral membrane protein
MVTFLATADLATANLHTVWDWTVAILQIVLIDIVLAGDNAVVIALAVRQLEKKERFWGIVIGSGMAVILRVALTFVASQLINLDYVKVGGGVLILWIAVKLLSENTGTDQEHAAAKNLWHAVWLITIADITMSLDNVLAVAGASKGSFGLLLFGLGLSIPLVVFTSSMLSRLMDRYPVVVYLGSAVLGWVGGGMIVTDRLIVGLWPATGLEIRAVEVLCATLVVLTPLARRKLRRRAPQPAAPDKF